MDEAESLGLKVVRAGAVRCSVGAVTDEAQVWEWEGDG